MSQVPLMNRSGTADDMSVNALGAEELGEGAQARTSLVEARTRLAGIAKAAMIGTIGLTIGLTLLVMRLLDDEREREVEQEQRKSLSAWAKAQGLREQTQERRRAA